MHFHINQIGRDRDRKRERRERSVCVWERERERERERKREWERVIEKKTETNRPVVFVVLFRFFWLQAVVGNETNYVFNLLELLGTFLSTKSHFSDSITHVLTAVQFQFQSDSYWLTLTNTFFEEMQLHKVKTCTERFTDLGKLNLLMVVQF